MYTFPSEARSPGEAMILAIQVTVFGPEPIGEAAS